MVNKVVLLFVQVCVVLTTVKSQYFIYPLTHLEPEASRNTNLVSEQWKAFKETYNKTYKYEAEERARMEIYVENLHKIAQHNRDYENGLVSFTMKENKFADISHDEFGKMMNGFKPSKRNNTIDEEAPTYIEPENVKLPSRVDWREEGAVTEVKDQGQCGSYRVVRRLELS